MTVDWSKVGSKASAASAKHEDMKANTVVQIGNAVGRRLDTNPYDPTVHAVLVLLGLVKDGDVKDALSKAGIEVSKTEEDDSSPKELVATTGKLADYWRVYEADGVTEAPPTETQYVHKSDPKKVIDLNLEPLIDPSTGVQKGLRKRPPLTGTPTPPAPATDKVKVMKRDGTLDTEIPRADYDLHPELYKVIEVDAGGKPSKVRKVHFIGR